MVEHGTDRHCINFGSVPTLLPPRARSPFRWQRSVIRTHVRSDDLITFGAEKSDSLVSLILSVKYS
jgi:hypothetical protein